MGGGGYLDKTAQGIIAAGSVYNSSYGKMAADSIAKEIDERALVAATARTEVVASGADPVAPATGADKIKPSKDEGAGVPE
jgi:hypothetical protein